MFRKRVLYRIMLLQLVPFCLTYFNALQGQTFFQSPYSLSNAPSIYRSRSILTTVHESTHGINSILRNQYGSQCYYVGQKQFVKVSRTGIRLSQLAQQVRYRGGGYTCYLYQQQRYWNDTALYVYDEWTAYTNGAAVAVYNKVREPAWLEVERACEIGYYCYVLKEMTPANYRDRDELNRIWKWQARRCVAIADAAEKNNIHYRASIRPWREWLRAKLN